MSDPQNLMTCPEPLELIDGVGPERVEARRRLETHARGCARCGPQLQALLQADQLLARQLLGDLGSNSQGSPEAVPSETCPAPDVLAAWIEGDRAGLDFESHLAACASCREDVLVARDLEGLSGPVAAPLEFQVPARSSRATLLLWTAVAAAAVVVLSAGLGFILGSMSPGGLEGPGTSDGAQLSRGPDGQPTGQEPQVGATPSAADSQGDSAVEPATEPAVEPVTEPVVEPVTEPAVEPVTEPAVEPVTEPAVEPVTEPAVEPVTEPAVEPRRADPVEPPSVTPDDPVVVVTRVDVLATLGIQFQRGGASQWRDLSAGQDLFTGDQLRASRSGGWIQMNAADVYLAPQARAAFAFATTLALERGGVWLETTRRFVVSSSAGEVHVNGDAFIQAVQEKLKILVHRGAALGLHRATGQQKKISKGQSLSVSAKALGRVAQLKKLPAAPQWAREFRARVKPEDPGKSGGGTRGRTGGTGGGRQTGGTGGGRQMRSRAAGAGGRR